MNKIFIKMFSLFLSVLALLTFTACGDPGNGDGDGDGDGGGHQHVYSQGLCSCREVDYNHVTEGLIYSAVEGGYEVINYVGDDSIVIIPLTHEGEKVVSIGMNAFEGCVDAERIYMSENVVQIKENAFYSCAGLKIIQIGKGVKTMGSQSFAECLDLITILYDAVAMDALPYDNLTFMHSGNNADGITMVVNKNVTLIPEALMYYGSSVDRPKFYHLVFEDNSECLEIGANAFAQQRDLRSIDFGENSKIKKFGRNCFSNNASLSKLTIPASVRVIERRALNNLSYLSILTVEDPEGWCVRKFDENSQVVDYQELTKEQMQHLKDEMATFNEYYYSKVSDGIPSIS